MFSAQLEKSRDATTAANLRSAYAEAVAAYIADDDSAANVAFNSATEHNVVKVSGVQLLDTDKDLKEFKRDIPAGYYLRPIPQGQLDGMQMDPAEKKLYQNPAYVN